MKKDKYESKDKLKVCLVLEYESISELLNEITNKDSIKLFRGSSVALDKSAERTKFTGTKDFGEAVDLLVNGWDVGIKELNKKIKANKLRQQDTIKAQSEIGMVGYQPIVPNYIMGLPNNMLGTKMKPVKQKVINIIKNVSYNCETTQQQIYDESIKSLEIIMALERAGYRINLYTMFGSRVTNAIYARYSKNLYIIFLTKIKGANQRLNINKTAFPLCHSSFIRRIMLRAIETSKDVEKALNENINEMAKNFFKVNYGIPVTDSQVNGLFKKDFYILPAAFSEDFNIDKIKSLEDLKNFKSVKFI